MGLLQSLQRVFLKWRVLASRPPRIDLDDETWLEFDEEIHTSLKKFSRHKPYSEGRLALNLIEAQVNADLELIKRWQNLTFREQQVATLICQGFTNRQIAAQLILSPQTVKVYVRHVFVKMGFHSRKELRTSLCEWVSQGMTPDR